MVCTELPRFGSADVYSYGIVLWEIATRRCPYEGMQPIQAAMKVLHESKRPDHALVPTSCPGACVNKSGFAAKLDNAQSVLHWFVHCGIRCTRGDDVGLLATPARETPNDATRHGANCRGSAREASATAIVASMKNGCGTVGLSYFLHDSEH